MKTLRVVRHSLKGKPLCGGVQGWLLDLLCKSGSGCGIKDCLTSKFPSSGQTRWHSRKCNIKLHIKKRWRWPQRICCWSCVSRFFSCSYPRHWQDPVLGLEPYMTMDLTNIGLEKAKVKRRTLIWKEWIQERLATRFNFGAILRQLLFLDTWLKLYLGPWGFATFWGEENNWKTILILLSKGLRRRPLSPCFLHSQLPPEVTDLRFDNIHQIQLRI